MGSHPVTSPLAAIIHDDEAPCSSPMNLLRSIGYSVEPFFSAQTFLTSSKLLSLDLIVAEAHMSGMRGLTLASNRPVILITAMPHKHLDDEATAVGPASSPKPVRNQYPA